MLCGASPCACRCCFPSTRDTQNIDRWSLKFHDHRAEEAFVRNKRHHLSRSVYKGSIIVSGLCLTLASIILSEKEHNDDELTWSFEQKKLGILAFFIALVSFVCIVFKMPVISDFSREVLLTGACILGVVAGVFIDSWYLYKLHGVQPSQENLPRNSAFSDSKMLLVLDGVITLTHLLTPVRWIVLVPLEISVVLLYATCMFLGGPEEETAYFNCLLLMALVSMAALGKRTIEYLERLAFLKLLHEKRLRFQTEFKLEMIRAPKVEGEVDASSDTTANIFDPMETFSPDASRKLEEIAEVGRSEQWIIDKAELRILRDCHLGAGGFGIVVGGFFCEKPVAVKIAQRLDTNEPWRNIVAISNEVRVLRRVRHPNIVLFHGAYVDPQQCDLALVLERVNGSLLSIYVERHKFDEHASSSSITMNKCQFGQLSFGLCHALIYLHSRKPSIVHGDLKPENIVVERSDFGPSPKLLDFGLSRILSSGTKPKGRTVAWASPEVLLRPHDKAQTFADVFSFGCILYFILSSTEPREGQTRRQVMASARRGAEMLLRWPCDRPFIEECRPPIIECVQPMCDRRPSIKNVLEQLSVIIPQPRRSVHPGEYPTAEVFNAVRQTCRQLPQQPGNILEVDDPNRMNNYVLLHDNVLGEDAARKKRNEPLQDSLQELQWLDAIVVDCDIFQPAVPVRKCSVCYASLSSMPTSQALNLPSLLSEWVKPDSFEELSLAMQSFVNQKINGMRPHPCGVSKLTFTSVLQLKDARKSGGTFVGSAHFCEAIEDLCPSTSNTSGGERIWLVRVVFTDFKSSGINNSSSASRIKHSDSDLATIPEGQSSIEL